MRLRIRRVQSEAEFLAMAPAWTDLAARSGQTGSARYAARSASGIPTTSLMNAARAPSLSPAAIRSRRRASIPCGW